MLEISDGVLNNRQTLIQHRFMLMMRLFNTLRYKIFIEAIYWHLLNLAIVSKIHHHIPRFANANDSAGPLRPKGRIQHC